MFFSKKRHLDALNGFREYVRAYGVLKKELTQELGSYCYAGFYCYSNKEIIEKVKILGDEGRKRQWEDMRSGYRQKIDELESTVISQNTEIERLKEVIACVSSRIIEIVEQENKCNTPPMEKSGL